MVSLYSPMILHSRKKKEIKKYKMKMKTIWAS